MSIVNRGNSRLSPEYVLLGYLHQCPSYGYELHRRLTQELGNIWHASQSQTYNILNRLEMQGHILSTIVEQEKLPSKQLLQITDSGEARFISWLNHPTKSSVHAIRVEFITRLYFMQLYYPHKIPGMIQDQLTTVNAELTELQANLIKLSGNQTFSRLALDLRIKLLSSVVSWLNECYEAFRS